MDKGQTRRYVVVLGMHRSGTSVITNILSRAGYFLGEEQDLMKGTAENRDGYFERWSVVRMNEHILNLCGGRWDATPDSAIIAGLRIDPQIEELILPYRGHDRVVIKDPRMCLTFPVWRAALGSSVQIIHMTRDPEAVALSLMKRDGFSRQKALALISLYADRAADNAKGLPSHSLRYEDLFTDERPRILKELEAFLGIDIDLEAIARSVVDRTLDHSQTPIPQTMRNGEVSASPVKRTVSIIIPAYNKI